MKKIMSVLSMLCVLGLSVNLNGGTFIVLTPLLLPSQSSPSWALAADNVIAHAKTNGLTVSTAVTHPTNYTQCNYRIAWSNLIYSTTVNMWAGQLNSSSPFNNERGQIVWVLIDASSSTGSDDVALDSLSIRAASNDSGNLLNDSITFTGLSYSPRAIGIKADGSIITSGVASQKAKRILVLVRTRLFNGGDTQAGLDQVRNWVNSITPYTLSFVAQVIGADDTKSFASVSTTAPTFVQPKIALVKQVGNSGFVSAANMETNRTYVLYGRQSVATGTWIPRGVMTPGSSVNVPLTLTLQQEFFKLVLQ